MYRKQMRELLDLDRDHNNSSWFSMSEDGTGKSNENPWRTSGTTVQTTKNIRYENLSTC